MVNHPNRSPIAAIRRHITDAGYSDADARHGISWAKSRGFATARDGYALAMSRILYSDEQLAEGAHFPVAHGRGPR